MSENQNKSALKKKLIIALAIIIGTLLVLYLLTLLIPYIYNNITESEETEFTADYSFYEQNYDENIFDDEYYMELIDDGILTYDNAFNSITVVTPETSSAYDEPVALLTNMVYSIVNGDNTKYNACFSATYFEKNLPKEAFTMQKIYNAEIKFLKQETVEDNSSSYAKYVYALTYSIYENNGSFRTDIGNGYRKQYISITNREGKYLIDSITYEKSR